MVKRRSQSRTEFGVGVIVLTVLVLLAGLLLRFSKGNALFRKTYTIILHASNAGAIRKKSEVLMSGVRVRSVSDITLDPRWHQRLDLPQDLRQSTKSATTRVS